MSISQKFPAAENDRGEAKRRFLNNAGWSQANASPIAGDASSRSYERLRLAGRRAILMNAPPSAETASCPPDASPEDRRRLGYNAMARLAGPNLNAFTQVAETLRRAGLSAPEILAADPISGFALIEDLGDELYVRAIQSGAPELELYSAAIDALVALRRAGPSAPNSREYRMLDYDAVALAAETELVLDWYWPYIKGGAIDDEIRADYRAAWREALEKLSPPSMIVLRDYHAENLLWLPDRIDHARAGVIDFQDGLFGNPAYDLVSLLEDARRDVPRNLAEAMIDRYSAAASDLDGFDSGDFLRDYAILGAQRNAKILGIFARLINRDRKPKYAQFFPRVEAHFSRNIAHPDLAPVRRFFANHFGSRF